MSHKLCPFGFYSFYVNKQVAQAGGCHHCVEDRCALWDTYYDEYGNTVGQCALMSITESLRSIADASESSGRALPIAGQENTKRPKAANAIGGVLEKLKAKKAAKEAAKETEGSENTQATPTPPPPAPPPAPNTTTTSVTPAPAPAPAPASAVPAISTPVPPAAPKPLKPVDITTTEDDMESLLKPPSVPISELPVISKSKEITDVKPSNSVSVEVTVNSEVQDD